MHYPQNPKPQHDPIAMVANVAGIASFILAVAGNNIDKLTVLQKLGLSIASTVMIVAFMGGSLIRYVVQRAKDGETVMFVAALFFGGWIGGGLLLAVVPLFGFGLPSTQIDLISMVAAGLFAAVLTILGAFNFFIHAKG